MANDRNSGMNIPIPFRQIITKWHNPVDWAWLDAGKVANFHVGIREDESEIPDAINLTLNSDVWWEDHTNVWFCRIVDEVKPTTVTVDTVAKVLDTSVDIDTDHYYWEKGKGLYVYHVGTPDDVVVAIDGESLRNIYALTAFGINSEELLNGPCMEIDEGFYSFVENISVLDDAAVFRTAAATYAYQAMVRYRNGENGFFSSFMYHRRTRPYQWLFPENQYHRKYPSPVTAFSYAYADDSVGAGLFYALNKNFNIICSSRMKDLESIKYDSLANIATKVFDPRSRAFIFGAIRFKEYVGAVHANWYDFMNACQQWSIMGLKMGGKIQDWKAALTTENAGGAFVDVTSDMNLKNDIDFDLNHHDNHYVYLCSDNKFFAITLYRKFSTGEAFELEYLDNTDTWVAISHTLSSPDTSMLTGAMYHLKNTSNSFNMKMLGEMYHWDCYDVNANGWTKRTVNGVNGYWIRVQLAPAGAASKLAWIAMSGVVFFDQACYGNLFSSVKLTSLANDTSAFVPLSLNYFSDKKVAYGCFYDVHRKNYYPFAVKFNKTNIDDSAKRSWEVDTVRLIDDTDKYNFGNKFHSFAFGSNVNIYGLLVDDKKPTGVSKLAKFPADFTGSRIITKANDSHYIGKYKGRLVYTGATDDELILWNGKDEIVIDISGCAGDDVRCTCEWGGNLYIGRAGTHHVIKYDGTSTLTELDEVTGLTDIYCLTIYGSLLYIGGAGSAGASEVYSYSGSGTAVTLARTSDNGTNATAMIVYQDKLFVGYDNNYIEMYNGTAWSEEYAVAAAGKFIADFFTAKGYLYAIYSDATKATNVEFRILKRDNTVPSWAFLAVAANGFSRYACKHKVLVRNDIIYYGFFSDGGTLPNIGYWQVADDGSISLTSGNSFKYSYLYGCVESLQLLGDTIYGICSDGGEDSGTAQQHIVAFNKDDFEIVQEMIGGDGNAPTPIKTNFAQLIFPNSSTADMLRKYTICGCTAPQKCVVWEYSHIKNFYVNLHSIVDKNLSSLINELCLVNNSVFFMDGIGRMIFKHKNIKGVSASVYTLSNHSNYGEGAIKAINSIAFYENIVNKVKTNWSNDLFGSGIVESGSGSGIGKQLNINVDIVDDAFKAFALSNMLFEHYSYLREQIVIDALILFFLERSDIISMEIEHPRHYVDSTKEWLLKSFTFDINQLQAKFTLIERLLEA